MSQRPDGTDGSDYNYREVVQDRYKRMAVYMSATWFLMRLQTVAVVLRATSHLIPLYTDGALSNYTPYVFFGVEALTNFFFYAGRPRGRVILMNMKLAASGIVIMIALSVVTLWKYHMLDPSYKQHPRRLFKHLKEEGTIESDKWLAGFTLVDTMLDMFMTMSLMACFYTINNWVKDGMEIEKEVLERNKANRAGSGSGGAPAAAKKRK